MPIGVYCRASQERSSEGESWVEIFGVVADPKTGSAVRVYHLAPRGESEPTALGRLTAEKLMEAGAGPLLATASEGAR